MGDDPVSMADAKKRATRNRQAINSAGARMAEFTDALTTYLATVRADAASVRFPRNGL